jgi:hypothetical protein
MKKFLFLGWVLTIPFVYAGKNKEHRHHEAHVHGHATLNIAFDQVKGKVEFKAASQSILGFEHQAKSEKDKKIMSEAISIFETAIGSMVKFDESLGCVFMKEKIEMMAENQGYEKYKKGEHSDFVASYNVECKKELKGTKVTFDFTQFKGIKDLDVTLLVDDLQKTVEVKRKPVTVELK